MAERIDLDGLAERLAASQGPGRRIVAVAGAPGSGKSHVADALAARLAGRIATDVLPMDGFHYDDILLEARGHRSRKGAPHTFDVDGLAAMLARLRADDGRDVAVPVFDRSIEIARAGARIIAADTRLVIVEGNYLLLDDPAWAPLAPQFDLTAFLSVPETELARRLRARWEGYGLGPAEVVAKLEENDLPNARRVVHGSRPADFIIENYD